MAYQPSTIEINGETFTITTEGKGPSFIQAWLNKGAFGWGEATLAHGDTLRIDLPSDLSSQHKAELSTLVVTEIFRELAEQQAAAEARRDDFLTAVLNAAPEAIGYWASTAHVEHKDGVPVLIVPVDGTKEHHHTITRSKVEQVFAVVLRLPVEHLDDDHRRVLLDAYSNANASTLDDSDLDAVIELAAFGTLALW